jgi:hypothetical protein
MNINPLHEEAIIIHGTGIGAVSRGMIRERATELAMINGRLPHEVTQADWDEATRELTGGGELDGQQALLESLPESARWNPVPGTDGHEAPVSIDDGDDAEGRGIGERLVEAGVEEAGHDQMLEDRRKNLSADD